MIPLLVNPSLLVIMGLTVGLLWIAIRQHRPHLALIAAGFMLFSVGVAAQILRYPAELRLNAVVSAVLYSTGASAFALGVVRRSSAKGGGPALLGLTALIIAGIAWYAYVDRNLISRVYVLNFGLALIFLYAAWRIRHNMRGSFADRLLFWAVLCTGLHFFPRTLFTLGSISREMTPDEFGSTAFWQLSLYVMGVLSAIMGVATIIVTGLDVVASIRDERDTDPLTGVYNRRALDRILKKVRSLDMPVSILVCDIDHFKRVNDTYGHHGGDIVLQHFVRQLTALLRPRTFLARLGGEEFVIVMPGISLPEAVREAERIRASHLVMGDETPVPGITVRCSIGVALLRPGEDPWQAVRRADDMLYQAKQNGRNCVVSERPVRNSGSSQVSEPA